MEAHLAALHAAGEAGRCDAEIERVRRALAADPALSDADLARERAARETASKGSMPYPAPGTACAVFGIQRALDGAIQDRRGK